MIFDYPKQRYRRRHGPGGYRVYHPFKEWLRDEFTFRCVFCLSRERWYPFGHVDFSVDHFISQSSGIGVLDYDNLLYACLRCNSFKRDLPRVLDPCVHPYGSHIRVNNDGTVTALTARGRILIDTFRLDRAEAIELRREKFTYFHWLQRNPTDPQIEPWIRQNFYYPDDLPDLRKKKPPRNSRPQGVARCYFALRESGKLPESY